MAPTRAKAIEAFRPGDGIVGRRDRTASGHPMSQVPTAAAQKAARPSTGSTAHSWGWRAPDRTLQTAAQTAAQTIAIAAIAVSQRSIAARLPPATANKASAAGRQTSMTMAPRPRSWLTWYRLEPVGAAAATTTLPNSAITATARATLAIFRCSKRSAKTRNGSTSSAGQRYKGDRSWPAPKSRSGRETSEWLSCAWPISMATTTAQTMGVAMATIATARPNLAFVPAGCTVECSLIVPLLLCCGGSILSSALWEPRGGSARPRRRPQSTRCQRVAGRSPRSATSAASETRRARVSGRFASAIQPRTPLRAEGEYASKWSRAPGRAASARARSFRYCHLLHCVETGPRSVGPRHLDGTSPRLGHHSGRLQPGDPLLVRSCPDAAAAARGEANHRALVVDPPGLAVDPAETERFLYRLFVGDGRPVQPRFPADEPHARGI